MSEVLAVVEPVDADPDVLTLARSVAAVLDAEVREFAMSNEDAAACARAVLAEQDRDEVRAVVLSNRADPHGACWEVIADARKPVVVLPRHAGRPGESFTRVLMPLDGDQSTAAAVAPLAHALLVAGSPVLAVHVFDASTVPAFWDQAAHTRGPWAEEFLLRNLPEGVDLELLRGVPAEAIVAAAEAHHADLVVLGWSQRLSEGRAPTVRGALVDGTVPVMLLGTGA